MTTIVDGRLTAVSSAFGSFLVSAAAAHGSTEKQSSIARRTTGTAFIDCLGGRRASTLLTNRPPRTQFQLYTNGAHNPSPPSSGRMRLPPETAPEMEREGSRRSRGPTMLWRGRLHSFEFLAVLMYAFKGEGPRCGEGSESGALRHPRRPLEAWLSSNWPVRVPTNSSRKRD